MTPDDLPNAVEPTMATDSPATSPAKQKKPQQFRREKRESMDFLANL